MNFERYTDLKRLNFITNILESKYSKGARILDVGCGNGIISMHLGEKGFNVKGIDISEKAINKARLTNILPNVEFELISAEQLIAKGDQYEAIVCSEVLEHLNDPGKLLSVLHAMLSANGSLIVTVPNGKGPRELFVTKPVIRLQKKNNVLWRLIASGKKTLGYKGTTVQSSADDLTHIQFFTKSSLENLAVKNQFRIIQLGKTNFIEDVFPFSLLTKRIKLLQKWDCALAEYLPYSFTGGFVSVWQKSSDNQ